MTRRIQMFFSAVFVFFLLSLQAHAQSDRDAVFTTPAEHLIIMDYDSGEILFEKNAREPMAPASMTKIMTATIVFDQLKSGALSMDDEFSVSVDAWRRGGAKSGSSTMYLDPNSKVKVRDLIRGVIVQSGNDACIVLAEGIAGSERGFAKLMNKKAKELGLSTAHFENATGWPHPDHKISAYELARLAHHTIDAYPEYYKIYAEKSFTWNNITQPNRNPLLQAGYPGADGLKTGHTKISKYGFVGSAIQGGDRRLFVVNGLESKAQRRSESLRIMDAAFQQFRVFKLYSANQKVGSAKVYMGKSETVPLHTQSDVKIGMHRVERADTTAEIEYLSPVPAPINTGDEIAKLVIKRNDKIVKTVPLFAGESVARKSAMGRIAAVLIAKIRG